MANKFLEDTNGNQSSKRLSLVSSLCNAISLTWAVAGVLLYKQQYDLAVHTVEMAWFATFVLGGYVASEYFAPNKKLKDNENSTN